MILNSPGESVPPGAFFAWWRHVFMRTPTRLAIPPCIVSPGLGKGYAMYIWNQSRITSEYPLLQSTGDAGVKRSSFRDERAQP